MKTKNLLKKMVIANLLLLSFIAPSVVKAQIASPYPITNNLTGSCDIEVSYVIYDSSCGVACGVGGSGTLFIAAGSTSFVPVCSSGFDIDITVNWILNPICTVTQIPSPVNTFCSSNANATLTTGCTCPTAIINVAATGATVN